MYSGPLIAARLARGAFGVGVCCLSCFACRAALHDSRALQPTADYIEVALDLRLPLQV
jgi:hypothetical protein